MAYPYNGILLGNKKYVASWMSLENTILNEETSHKRLCTVWFYLYEMSSIGESMETESRLMVV